MFCSNEKKSACVDHDCYVKALTWGEYKIQKVCDSELFVYLSQLTHFRQVYKEVGMI